MPTVVVPFAGVEGKTRLHTSRRARRLLSLAMLGDVLAAAASLRNVLVVTSDAQAEAFAARPGASPVAGPGGGHGAAGSPPPPGGPRPAGPFLDAPAPP